MNETTARRVLGPMLWSTLSSTGGQVVTFIVFVTLARLLGSRDFGLVALAALIVDLMQVVSAGGVTEAVVQRPELREQEADTAFWLNLGVGAVFLAIGEALAAPLAAMIHQPALRPVLQALCLLFIITPAGSIHSARMMRDLRFKPLAVRNVGANLVAGAIGVALAFAGLGVWALVAQRLVAATLVVALVWRFSGWLPRLRFEWRAVRTLLGFGSNLMFSQLLMQLNSRAVELITGSMIGPLAVGFIRAGSRCMDLINQVTLAPFHQITLPLQARAEGDRDRVRATYAMLSRASSLAMFPAFIGAGAIAQPLILLMLGPAWAPAADVLRLLSVLAIPGQFNTLMLSGLAAAGRPKLVLAWSSVQVVVGLAATVAAAHFGWRAMLAANVARSYLLLPVGVIMLRRATPVDLGVVVKSIAPAVGASCFMAASVMLFDSFVAGSWPLLVRLAALVVLGGGAYAAAALVLDRQLPTELRAFWAMRSQIRGLAASSERST